MLVRGGRRPASGSRRCTSAPPLPPLADGNEVRVSLPGRRPAAWIRPPPSGPLNVQLAYQTCLRLKTYADAAGAAGRALVPDAAAAAPAVSRGRPHVHVPRSGRACASRRRPARRSRPRRSARASSARSPPGLGRAGDRRRTLVARHRRRRRLPRRPRRPRARASSPTGDRLRDHHRAPGRRLPGPPGAAVLLRRAGGDADRARRRREPLAERRPVLRRVARRPAAPCSSATPPTPARACAGRERIVYETGLPTARATALLDGGAHRLRALRLRHQGPARAGRRARAALRGGQRRGGGRAAALLPRARRPGVDLLAFNTRRGLFRDVRLRRAVNVALDRPGDRGRVGRAAERPLRAAGGARRRANGSAYPVDGPDLDARADGSRRRGRTGRSTSTSAARRRTAASWRSCAPTWPAIGIRVRPAPSLDCTLGRDPKIDRAELMLHLAGVADRRSGAVRRGRTRARAGHRPGLLPQGWFGDAALERVDRGRATAARRRPDRRLRRAAGAAAARTPCRSRRSAPGRRRSTCRRASAAASSRARTTSLDLAAACPGPPAGPDQRAGAPREPRRRRRPARGRRAAGRGAPAGAARRSARGERAADGAEAVGPPARREADDHRGRAGERPPAGARRRARRAAARRRRRRGAGSRATRLPAGGWRRGGRRGSPRGHRPAAAPAPVASASQAAVSTAAQSWSPPANGTATPSPRRPGPGRAEDARRRPPPAASSRSSVAGQRRARQRRGRRAEQHEVDLVRGLEPQDVRRRVDRREGGRARRRRQRAAPRGERGGGRRQRVGVVDELHDDELAPRRASPAAPRSRAARRARRRRGRRPASSGGAPRRALGGGASQRGVVAQDLPLELLQRRRRLDPERVDQRAPQRRGRRRAPPAAGPRGRAPSIRWPCRRSRSGCSTTRRVELGDQLGGPAERAGRPRCGPRCAAEAQLLQARDRGRRERLEREVGERLAAPQPERVAQPRRRLGRIAARRAPPPSSAVSRSNRSRSSCPGATGRR